MSEETAAPPSAGDDITQPSGDTTQQSGTWFEGFSDDNRAFLTAKGWDKEGKGPEDVLTSFRNLERLRGVNAEDLVRLPKDEKSTEEFYKRLGVPEEASGYETPAVEINGQSVDGEVMSNISHSLKHTPEQHAAFVEAVGEFLGQAYEQQSQAAYERDSAEKVALEKEWGGRTQENMQAAAKAANQFGVDTEVMNKIQQGLGYKGTVELFAKIGRAFGEARGADAPRGTDTSPLGMTPEAARTKLQELRGDAGFREALMNGDVSARERWDKLNSIAFHGA